MNVLIFGLPESGKTTLARQLTDELPRAVHVNADVVRHTLSADLGFSYEDRLKHARRMSQICDIICYSGKMAIADFVCPTGETRDIFKPGFTIFMDTVPSTRYEDTNKMFVRPDEKSIDVVIRAFDYDVDDIALAIKKGMWNKLSLDKEARKFDFDSPTSFVIMRDVEEDWLTVLKECHVALEEERQICIGLACQKDYAAASTELHFRLQEAGVFKTSSVHIIRLPNIERIAEVVL